MKKKNKIYKDYSKITNATKGNKNIILIAGAIILVGLLYYMLSPYQQCVRGYVKMSMNRSYYEGRSRSELAPIKAGFKARGQVLCTRRMN